MEIGRRFFATGALLLAAAPTQVLAKAPARAKKGGMVDLVEVHKASRKLHLIGQGSVLKEYDIRLGGNPVGPKRFQGDKRTPEGEYRINGRNPQSAFYRSLRVSYPNRLDMSFAARRGKHPGGDIFLHGQPNGFKRTILSDWTRGCVALSNDDMDELWRYIPVGCPIRILG